MSDAYRGNQQREDVIKAIRAHNPRWPKGKKKPCACPRCALLLRVLGALKH